MVWRLHSPFSNYVYSTLLVAAATLVGFPIHFAIHPTNQVMLYLAVVVISAAYLGRGPSLLASLLSVLAFDFFFVDPRFTLNVSDTQYLITFIGLLGVSLTISTLTARIREQGEAASQREAHTAALYSLSRDLTTAVGIEGVLEAVVRHIRQTFDRDVAVWLAQDKSLQIREASPNYPLDEGENAAALWAYEHGQPAGKGTDTLSTVQGRYTPLKTIRGSLGVIGVKPEDTGMFLSPPQRRLLEAYASLAALAVERADLAEQASQTQVLKATERLHSALLNSISHDLRTPLSAINGALDSLRESELDGTGSVILDRCARLDLLDSAHEEASRLNRLVGNLLDMTRLEAGVLQLNRVDTDVQDLVGAALSHLSERLGNHPIATWVSNDLPMVPMDFILIEQVLINLLDNAAKYTPAGASIEIRASLVDQHVQFTVADHGIGVPVGDIERIFDKFHRIHRPNGTSGTGLGLSICKGIVEAHEGAIWAKNRPEGGLEVTFTLPLEPEDRGLPGREK